MGLLKWVKGFFNIGGVRIDGVEFGDHTLSLDKSRVEGSYDIVAGTDSVVLSTIHTLYVERLTVDDEGNETLAEVEIGVENSEELDDCAIDYPFEIKEGERRCIGFCLSEINIEKVLNEVGEYNMGQVVTSNELAFYLKLEVDIKGTPFDPELKLPLRAVLAECGKV